MKNTVYLFLLLVISFSFTVKAQDLTQGLQINDLALHPMQDIAKPAYLNTIIDPSFGTTIRRITNAGTGNVIVPMYSTVQAWNADESLMIVYDQSNSEHQLLNGMTYEFLRYLDDFYPNDLEQIFWDFNDPDVLYYLDGINNDFVKYTVSNQTKEVLVNLETVTTNCNGGFNMGNDVQMMSWDSDIFAFRCNNDAVYHYKISTAQLTEFNISDVAYTAPMPGPSGNLFYHRTNVYDAAGNFVLELNESSTEHSCLGKLANGNDAHFAIAFAQGPDGGCIGDIIAHDMTTGNCFPIISQSQGYDYPQSGTHISALSHKNTEGGWVAASMMGYDKDGQSLLDQELVIAKAEEGNVKVCRIGHHRSDEDDVDYWGEPHACISPSGTRVLFASDWSGAEDGQSIDCYVVELPAFSPVTFNLSLKVFLEGAYNNDGSMRTILSNYIPFQQPYNISPYNYNGNENLLNIPSNMVDWILVEARTGTPNVNQQNTTIVETKAGLLFNNGEITDIAGNPLRFNNLIEGDSYYFAIRHRNHLDVLTASSLIAQQNMSYDFTISSTMAFGPQQQSESQDGNAMMFTGDYNHDGVIQVSDYDVWKLNPAQLNVYGAADGNLDGTIQNTDSDAWQINKAKIGVGEIRF